MGKKSILFVCADVKLRCPLHFPTGEFLCRDRGTDRDFKPQCVVQGWQLSLKHNQQLLWEGTMEKSNSLGLRFGIVSPFHVRG